MTRRHLWGWGALGAGVVLLLGGAALLFRGAAVHAPARKVIEITCNDVVAGCEWVEHGLRVRFDSSPQPMKPFVLGVRVAGAHEVHARFAMRDMQMGVNRYRLLSEGTDAWKAEVTLPVCMQGRGDWELLLEVDDRQYRLPFTSG